MSCSELALTSRQIEDYTEVDSEALLNRYEEARRCHDLVKFALEEHIFSLNKEFVEAGRSQVAEQLAEVVLHILNDFDVLTKRIAAIIREVLCRCSRNAVNKNFGLLKMGDLQGDLNLQKRALTCLHNLLTSIPRKEGWFHKENREGSKSLANLLLAKELRKHANLDQRATLERMMDNEFAYLYCAYERDFKDEMDKTSKRPFEVPPDDKEKVDDGSDLETHVERQQLVIRLYETAEQQDNPTDREIVRCFGDLLSDEDLLRIPDWAIRAQLVNKVSDRLEVSKQLVRRYITRATVLPAIRRDLQLDPTPPQESVKVILTDYPTK